MIKDDVKKKKKEKEGKARERVSEQEGEMERPEANEEHELGTSSHITVVKMFCLQYFPHGQKKGQY